MQIEIPYGLFEGLKQVSDDPAQAIREAFDSLERRSRDSGWAGRGRRWTSQDA
jgi:hypothetical protein